MADYLLFRLYGPLASWGDQAVGERRPDRLHPSRSGVLGLLAAALGVPREEEGRLAAISQGYGLAVRMDAAGMLLRDYHTIQVPGSRRGVVHRTRRDELAGRKEDLNTILSSRDYHTDGLATVCLWARAKAPHPLKELAEALQQPVFTPYLGRKSCVLALPMAPRVVAADNLAKAFTDAAWKTEETKMLRALLGWNEKELAKKNQEVLFYWDQDGVPGDLKVIQSTDPHDLSLSRKRWQFAQRREHMGQMAAAKTEG